MSYDPWFKYQTSSKYIYFGRRECFQSVPYKAAKSNLLTCLSPLDASRRVLFRNFQKTPKPSLCIKGSRKIKAGMLKDFFFQENSNFVGIRKRTSTRNNGLDIFPPIYIVFSFSIDSPKICFVILFQEKTNQLQK